MNKKLLAMPALGLIFSAASFEASATIADPSVARPLLVSPMVAKRAQVVKTFNDQAKTYEEKKINLNFSLHLNNEVKEAINSIEQVKTSIREYLNKGKASPEKAEKAEDYLTKLGSLKTKLIKAYSNFDNVASPMRINAGNAHSFKSEFDRIKGIAHPDQLESIAQRHKGFIDNYLTDLPKYQEHYVELHHLLDELAEMKFNGQPIITRK